MKCGEFLQRFEEYCRGDLTEEERRAFEQEVEVCKYLSGFKQDYETCLELIKCSCRARGTEEDARLPEVFVQTLVAQVTTVVITSRPALPDEPRDSRDA